MSPRGLLRRAWSVLPAGMRAPFSRLKHALLARSPRRRALEAAHRRRNAGLEPMRIALRDGLELALDPRARDGFEHFCFRSPEMVAELDGFLREAPRRQCLVDVGACHGLFSLAFVTGREGARALAVEPSVLAREVLAANVEANRASGVVVVEEALGAEPGLLRMRANWHHLEAVAGDAPDEGTVEIRVVTLDALCRAHKFAPDLIKIDVEGYELEVLHGAAEVLRLHRPLLLLELHPARLAELGHAPREILDFLSRHGYTLSRVGRKEKPLRQLRASDPVLRAVGRAGC